MPAGLTIDTELRWTVLQSLVANGAAGTTEIEAELAGDRTASGEREAAYAHALVATEANKATVWSQLTGPERAAELAEPGAVAGASHPAQVELIAPYRERYFATVAQVWAQRDSEPAQEFVQLATRRTRSSEETVAATDAWLAGDGHPASLRRLVAEGRDGVVRALKARARDAAAG